MERKGESMVPNSKSRQAVLTSSKLQSAPGTNKKRQFRRNSIFLFNSGRESQAKKTPTAFHRLIWFQRPLGVGTQSDNNPSFRPCPSCQLSLPAETEKASLPPGPSTWRKDSARSSRPLDGQKGPARTAESSRRP